MEKIRHLSPVLAGDYPADADVLRRAVDLWWANQKIHAEAESVDVDSTFDRLTDMLRQAKTLWECASALRENLWELMDGHLRPSPTHWKAEKLYFSGVRCMPVAEGVAIVNVDPRLHSEHLTYRGHLVMEVDSAPIESYLSLVRLRPGSSSHQRRWNAVQSLEWQERYPDENLSPKTLTIEDSNGVRHSLSLLWEPRETNRPTPQCVIGRVMNNDIGILEVRSFVCRDELGQISDREMLRQTLAANANLARVRHLVVDLRWNAGGRDEQAQMIARLFTDSPLEWMCYQHRDPYTGKLTAPFSTYLDLRSLSQLFRSDRNLCFLIGPGCSSTAEILASAFRARTSVRFVGEPTAGCVGDPLEFRLPRLLLGVTIPIAKYFLPGTNMPIEGRGVLPDLHITQTATDLQMGVDTALVSAVRAMREAT